MAHGLSMRLCVKRLALADFDLYLMDAVDGGNKQALTDTPTDEAVPGNGHLMVIVSLFNLKKTADGLST